MADTGVKSSGTITTTGANTYAPYDAWSDPSNASTVNGISAAHLMFDTALGAAFGFPATVKPISETLQFRNFSAGVPTGATINGVEAIITRSSDDGSGNSTPARDYRIQLVVGGAPSGSNKADTSTYYPASLTAQTYGSSSDLWGLILTDTQVNGSTFGIDFQAQNNGATDFSGAAVANIDAIQLKVYYTTGGGGPTTYTLTAVSKSLTFSKKTALLKKSSVLKGNVKSLTFSKKAAVLQKVYTLTGTSKSLGFSKKTALLTASRLLTGVTKSLTFSKKNALLRKDNVLVGFSRSLTFGKQDAVLKASRSLLGGSKDLTFTKQSANLVYTGTGGGTTYTLTGVSKSLAFSKKDAALKVNRTLVGGAKPLVFTKQVAALKASRLLIGASKDLSFSKKTAALTRTRTILGQSKDLTFSKKSALLTASRKLVGTVKALSFAKKTATLSKSYSLTGQLKAFTFSKKTANLTVQRKLVALTKSLGFSKKTANLIYSAAGYTLTGVTKSLVFTKQSAVLTKAKVLKGLTKVIVFGKGQGAYIRDLYNHEQEVCREVHDVATVTGICNQALGMVGAINLITSLAENSSEARVCNGYYNQTRLEILNAVPWPFMRRQSSLALLGAASGTDENPIGDGALPEDGWTYTYAYPCDCLKPIFIKPSTDGVLPATASNTGDLRDAQNTIVPYVESTQYDMAGNLQRVISTDKQKAILVFQADIKDPSVFPPDFTVILVQALAAKIVIPLTGDQNLARLHSQTTQVMINQAMGNHKTEYQTDRKPMIYNFTPDSLLARG